MNEWPVVPLRDVGTWFGGGTPAKNNPEFWDDGDIPWLSPKDMGDEVLTGTRDSITAAAVARTSVKLVPRHAVAVVVRSGILERTIPVALVPFATALNQDMKAVSPHANIDPRWVAWGLRAMERELLTSTRKAGTTVASIEWPRFLAFGIPVPPLPEQRRIVDVLEDHLSRLDAAAAGIVRNRARLTNLLAVELSRIDMIDDSGVRIDDIARVGSGATPLRSRRDFYDGGTIPWVTSGDLAGGRITSARQFITDVALAETAVKLWPAGSLLIAMYGEGKTRGTVAELEIDATTNQACAAIVLQDDSVEKRGWLKMVLRSRYEALRRAASGGVQPNLSLGLIRDLRVPWPDHAIMANQLDHFRGVEESISRLDAALRNAVTRSTSLRRALLAAAFSGRLTGAASELERIEELTFA